MIEIKVPELGESIQEVQILQWLKKEGEFVERDEDLVEVETEKASQVIPSPESGIIMAVNANDGEFAKVGDVIATLEKSDKPAAVAVAAGADSNTANETATVSNGDAIVMPAAERVLAEYKLNADQITATGPGGRLLKEDVLAFVKQNDLQVGGGVPPKSRAIPAPAASEKTGGTRTKCSKSGR